MPHRALMIPAKKAPRSVGVILSGTYVISSLISEFGMLPPAFMPVSNKRLYRLQVQELAPHVDQVVMTLPDDFEIETFDDEWLALHNVETIRTPPCLSLGQAITAALKALPDTTEEVWIYYGDTLLSRLDRMSPESAMVGTAEDYNRWGYGAKKADGSVTFCEKYADEEAVSYPVVVGCFRFLRQAMLESLRLANDNFFAALNIYAARHGLSLVDVGDDWHDFGHLQSYFRSRRNFAAARQFNLMRVEGRQLAKFSTHTEMIRAEAEWYQGTPRDLKVFLPAFLGTATHPKQPELAGYALEYMYLTPLNDLFVYGRLPQRIWYQVFAACQEFLSTCGQSAGAPDLAPLCQEMYVEKTAKRLEEFQHMRQISLDAGWTFNGRKAPSINKLFHAVAALVPPVPPQNVRISHGDFHFANIFYDSRSLGIKAVDPRGHIGNQRTIYGDCRYDIAKLAHSVYGLYDYILGDILRADVRLDHTIEFPLQLNYGVAGVQEAFADFTVNGYNARSLEIQAIVIMLFLSMLPIHKENEIRQKTMLANAYRLYFNLEDMKG